MAVVTSRKHRLWNRLLIALVFVVLLIYLLPLYWISSTAFKPRSLATTVPPTVVFEPELTPFVKLFTARVQMRGEVEREVYDKAPWYEKRVYDAGERIIKDADGKLESSGYLSRFLNSIIIAVTSTFLAVAMGTLTAYGFSRFRMPG
jgi:multiple sugar transport system permease protein